MKKYTLTAQKRDLVGRKVKQLRMKGLLPGTVYGKKVKSISISIKKDEFAKIHKEAGETGLVQLTLEGAATKDPRPVLIHTVQVDPVTSEPLHVELHQVDLLEKVSARVPLEQVGESPAVTGKTGVLITVLDEVEVEALPADLPEKITVDLSGLSEVGQEIKVSDLQIPNGVTVTADPSLTVVNVGALVSREAEELKAQETAAAQAQVAEAAPTEADVAKEEAPESEKPPEPAKETPTS